MTLAGHLWLCGHTVKWWWCSWHVFVCACVWQSIQMSIPQIRIDTVGWTHKYEPGVEVKSHPRALVWWNSPRGRPGWTPFKCFYCHFCLLLILDGGHCVWHFCKKCKSQRTHSVLASCSFKTFAALFSHLKIVVCYCCIHVCLFFYKENTVMWKSNINIQVNIIKDVRKDFNVYDGVKHAAKINMECTTVIWHDGFVLPVSKQGLWTLFYNQDPLCMETCSMNKL